jgi:signal transduction histidine kinase
MAKNQLLEMQKLQISLCLPISHNNKLIGILCLGDKLSDNPFFTNDIQILEILSRQIGTSLANALLYRNLEDMVRDRTMDLSAANQQLQHLNRQLEEISEAKTEFVSIASHQLKTPLTVIKSILSMLVSGDFGRLTDEQKDYLTRAFFNTEKLIKLVKDILNISKIETGKVQLKISNVDLNSLIEGIIKNYGDIAKNKGLKIIFEKTDIPVIKADREQVEQAIANLLDNAIKYTEQGEIKMWFEKENGAVVFKIKDTGVGMTKDEMKTLFEKFIRGKSGERLYTGGTGIGLYTARRIIEVHGGRIWAKSEGLGKGSLFAFSLPLE